MWDFHQVGRSVVSMLWISIKNQTTKLEVQSKTARTSKCWSQNRIDSNKQLNHFVGLLLNESRFSKTVVDIDKRSFTIQILLFDNGSFVSITEGQEKIGGLTASIGTNTIPITTSIIPAKSESLFLKLISQQLSSIISGINIISAFIPKELENKTAKTLIAKIKEIVEKWLLIWEASFNKSKRPMTYS